MPINGVRMTPTSRICAACALSASIVMTTGALVLAQSAGEPPPNVRMRLGPLYLNPTISLSNAGVDDNVFNDAAAPKSDVTITATPKTDMWLRFGPSWLTVNIREDIVYFQKSVSERSANNSYSAQWMIPLNRLTFLPRAAYTNTRERPGFEIDARAERAEILYGLQMDVKALSKTTVSVRASQSETLFNQDATFQKINLHDELNRRSMTETVSLQHQVTPLTTFAVDLSLTQDRFKYQTLRNSESTSLGGSVKFDPAALLKGSASFGYEDYRPADPSVPGYRGTTASVNLSYVLLGITKISGGGGRSVQYSYDINQPYYVQSGVSLEVSQQVFGPVDVVGRTGYQLLDYRNRVGAAVAFPDRMDHVKSYGGGVGYHLGRDTRLGFNLDHTERDSPLTLHTYKGLRYGFSVTYGGP